MMIEIYYTILLCTPGIANKSGEYEISNGILQIVKYGLTEHKIYEVKSIVSAFFFMYK